jgi:hypothetical protein
MGSNWLKAMAAGGEPKIETCMVFPAQISLSLL